MNDAWSAWVDHMGLSIAYAMEATQAAEAGDTDAAGLLRWEAGVHRYWANELARKVGVA